MYLTAQDEGIELPDQSHCTWLLNIIQLHARKIAKEEIAKQTCQTAEHVLKLNQEVKNLKDSLDGLQQQNVKQQRRLEKLEYENHQLTNKLQKVHLKVDELEQNKYQNSIQIVGLPDHENNDDMKEVIKITNENLGIQIKVTDIEQISRLGKKTEGKTRNVNVKFKEKSTREKVFQNRKKLITEKIPSRNIYINDCLTKHRQSVLYACRKQVKEKQLFAAWSQGGNILIRKEENGEITQINDHEDLRESLTDAFTLSNTETMNMTTVDESSIDSNICDYSF